MLILKEYHPQHKKTYHRAKGSRWMSPGHGTTFLGALFLDCRLFNMWRCKPEEKPLEYNFKTWRFFKIDRLKRKNLKLYCNMGWALYKLESRENIAWKWPENGSLNYNTILQLGLYVATWKNGLRFPMFKASWSWEFPGGPVVRTPSSHCWGARFDPSLGN